MVQREPEQTDVVASMCSFLGAAGYNRWFSGWEYQRSLSIGQAALVIVNVFDLVWVLRLNNMVGIPDELMLLGEDTSGPMINGLAYMPMNILAAKHMPPGVEATMYSLQMGLWNFVSDPS